MGATTIPGREGFDAIFGTVPAEVRMIGETLREAILAVDSHAHEIAQPGYRAVNYAAGRKVMADAYCYLMPQTARVNLGFTDGVALDDPEGLLEGTGKTLRHVKVADVGLARAEAVRSLIALAAARKHALSGPRS